MIKTESIQIQCPQCGETEFEQPDNVQDDDFVKCNHCKFEMMLADLKEVGIEQAKEVIIPEAKKEIENMLKKAFKGFK
ncbi:MULTISPECIES: hypothetical protein [unclassified Shewanella]|uniref:hypothetical protein n=1 Tax=unclassified Shewanella TaxID=196818 RepID=UPI000C84C2C3|nr:MULTISPECIES: hypothetical protein [unclassified Shewanella]MDO6617959.1 hypothetical protein [Shewanella sp. 6_MG-2023]MDO6639915.1 hypothetical protein [Shewanella sp. 5_MG-2023]PMG28115.1 hypothetical protein BCU94_03660 [Shewanella sp. 10N.286.52.C2]PMG40391.1 hypothetical protein BCU91_13065 [Shewanella sp. 10N.286.52.B9]PMH86931.1 hypothetical protein BCU57_08955 [Shewanella sp. 10N.286.48.B5]